MLLTSRRQTPGHRRVGHGQEVAAGPAAPKVLLRADSAFYGRGAVLAAVHAGAEVSVTVRLDPMVKAAIAAIPDDAWHAIEYTDASIGKFTANAAWLVLAVMAFNLTRAAVTLAGTTMAKATTATIRRRLVHVPARIASSARRLTLHLPNAWPWETAWTTLFTGLCAPPPPASTT